MPSVLQAGTAVYGTVRTVVWEGGGRKAAPYPMAAAAEAGWTRRGKHVITHLFQSEAELVANLAPDAHPKTAGPTREQRRRLKQAQRFAARKNRRRHLLKEQCRSSIGCRFALVMLAVARVPGGCHAAPRIRPRLPANRTGQIAQLIRRRCAVGARTRCRSRTAPQPRLELAFTTLAARNL
jgi:hypothetical protein